MPLNTGQPHRRYGQRANLRCPKGEDSCENRRNRKLEIRSAAHPPGFAHRLPPLIAGILEILIAAVAVRLLADGRRVFNSLRSLVVYIGVAVVLAPFTAAFIAAASAPENYWFSWRVWFLSEALAFVMLAPACLTWIDGARAAVAGASVARYVEAGLIGVGLLTICIRVFTSPTEAGGSIPALVYCRCRSSCGQRCDSAPPASIQLS